MILGKSESSYKMRNQLGELEPIGNMQVNLSRYIPKPAQGRNQMMLMVLLLMTMMMMMGIESILLSYIRQSQYGTRRQLHRLITLLLMYLYSYILWSFPGIHSHIKLTYPFEMVTMTIVMVVVLIVIIIIIMVGADCSSSSNNDHMYPFGNCGREMGIPYIRVCIPTVS